MVLPKEPPHSGVAWEFKDFWWKFGGTFFWLSFILNVEEKPFKHKRELNFCAENLVEMRQMLGELV